MNNNNVTDNITDIKKINDNDNIEDEEENEEETVSDENIIQIISFSLSNEVEYGIDILSIHEIQRMMNISRLPNTPDFILGVVNLRSNVIPVVDIRKRFGYSGSEHTEDTRIVFVDIGPKRVGLLVDRVFQVFRIPLKDISSPTELIDGISAEFISGVGRIKNKLIVILKLENILFLSEEE